MEEDSREVFYLCRGDWKGDFLPKCEPYFFPVHPKNPPWAILVYAVPRTIGVSEFKNNVESDTILFYPIRDIDTVASLKIWFAKIYLRGSVSETDLIVQIDHARPIRLSGIPFVTACHILVDDILLRPSFVYFVISGRQTYRILVTQ